jgi:hypothetical protein
MQVRRVRAPLARSGTFMGGDPRVLEEQRDRITAGAKGRLFAD